jgi:hypothetical protein
MDGCSELHDEIEQLRSYLVEAMSEYGQFISPQVLQASCLLDKLIVEHYRAKGAKQDASGARIA